MRLFSTRVLIKQKLESSVYGFGLQFIPRVHSGWFMDSWTCQAFNTKSALADHAALFLGLIGRGQYPLCKLGRQLLHATLLRSHAARCSNRECSIVSVSSTSNKHCSFNCESLITFDSSFTRRSRLYITTGGGIQYLPEFAFKFACQKFSLFFARILLSNSCPVFLPEFSF